MKYYVKFGNFRKMIITGNQYAACVKTFNSFMESKDRRTLPTFFTVSQRGYNKHDDDEIVATDFVIRILQVAAGEQ